MVPGLNPRLLEHVSSPVTSRPGLPPNLTEITSFLKWPHLFFVLFSSQFKCKLNSVDVVVGESNGDRVLRWMMIGADGSTVFVNLSVPR